MNKRHKARDMTKRPPAIALSLLLAVFIAGCASSTANTKKAVTPDNPVLVAVKATAALNIDGRIDENTWDKAAKTIVKVAGDAGVEPREVNLTALYDGENIYLGAAYKDATPLKVGETWEYDGSKWTKGAADDSLAFVWDINGSIKGFAENGAAVMTKKITAGIDIYDFEIDAASSKFCSAADTAQQGDVWGWCGMPEFYGKGDDMFLSINPGYAKSAVGVRPVIAVEHDAHPNPAPWVRNETEQQNPVPKYNYMPGLTQSTTPRPFMEDVIEITDYSEFKAGDRLPYIIGVKGAVWGGSKDDISVRGSRSGNEWNVEFSRKLNTGNADDIRLETGETASFFLIIRDDAKGYVTSTPVTLKFE